MNLDIFFGIFFSTFGYQLNSRFLFRIHIDHNSKLEKTQTEGDSDTTTHRDHKLASSLHIYPNCELYYRQ